jgi:carbonic anhydrase
MEICGDNGGRAVNDPLVERGARMGVQGLGSLFSGSRRKTTAAPDNAAGVAASAPRPRPPADPTPDQALDWLLNGNATFVSSGAIAGHQSQEISGLAKGQSPVAVVVGCSDSRVSPEILFHARLGDLFVVRAAGNTVDAIGLGSVEYGVHYLKCPLIMVLGHGGCGAVSAAARVVTDNAQFDGAVEDVILPILPAVLRAKASGANDLVTAAVREHVAQVIRRLTAVSSLAALIAEGRLKVVGAYYDLNTGRVDLIA